MKPKINLSEQPADGVCTDDTVVIGIRIFVEGKDVFPVVVIVKDMSGVKCPCLQ